MLKDQLELLIKEFNSLKEKIKGRLEDNQRKFASNNHKLELASKENSENEKVLELLLKEMKELEKELG
jgi:lipoate-protein ligase A